MAAVSPCVPGALPARATGAVGDNGQLAWLQSLRGIAALMVMFFHMAPHWALVPELQFLSRMMRWWFSGVDVFFVISGFVVYRSGSRSIPTKGIFDFFKKRFARIYLTYWPTLIAVGVIAIFFLNEFPKSWTQVAGSLLLVYPKFWDNWLPVAWSLTYELYFYFLLGWLLLLPKKWQAKGIAAFTLSVLAWNLVLLCFMTDRILTDSQPLPFLLGGFIVEFMAGALIAILFDARRTLFNFKWWSLPACALLIVGGFFIGSHSYYFNQVEIMRAGSYGLVALGGLLAALVMERTRLRPHRLLVSIGDFSFSLYLLHAVVLGVLGALRHSFLGDHPPLWLAYSLLMPVIIIFISYLWYQAVEVRTIRWIKRL